MIQTVWVSAGSGISARFPASGTPGIGSLARGKGWNRAGRGRVSTVGVVARLERRWVRGRLEVWDGSRRIIDGRNREERWQEEGFIEEEEEGKREGTWVGTMEAMKWIDGRRSDNVKWEDAQLEKGKEAQQLVETQGVLWHKTEREPSRTAP
jgi:hypothetical protein